VPGTRPRGRAALGLLLGAAIAAALLPAAPVAAEDEGAPATPGTLTGLATPPPELVVDLTFPTVPSGRFSDDFTAPRSSGRTHCAGDILGPKHADVYAAVGGTVSSMPMTKPSYGYVVNIQGDDGRRYSYLHLNDDRPGTNDDSAGPEHAYAPGLQKGSRVERGQLIGYLGDSGNAKGIDHLHFEIHDPAYETPACATGGATRINPYRSLRQAVARADFGGGGGTPSPLPTGGVARSIERACRPGQVPSSGFGDLGDVHRTGVECVAWWRVVVGRTASTFGPTGTITRDQLATFVANLAAAAGRPLPSTTTNHFDDDNGSVHEGNVNRVASAGIMGSATRSFSPGLAVSRGSMATVVANTYRHVARAALPAGPDAFGDDGAVASQASINSVAAAGIAVGYADGTFRPASSVTREQMATFFARLLDALVVDGHTNAR
jgi:hypothetical protein